MSKIKDWLGTLFTGALGSILATVIIASTPLLIAGIYTFYQDDPQKALLVVLTILVVINYLATIFLFLQQRSFLKLLREQNLLQGRTNIPDVTDNVSKSLPTKTSVSTDLQLRDVFKLDEREFLEDSTPQKLVIHLINRGNDIIRIKEVRLSLHVHDGLTDSDVSSEYRIGKGGRHIIPFDPDKAEMLPGKRFPIVINLNKRWSSKDINQLFGNLANLYIDLVYKDELIEGEFVSF